MKQALVELVSREPNPKYDMMGLLVEDLKEEAKARRLRIRILADANDIDFSNTIIIILYYYYLYKPLINIVDVNH